MPIWLQNATVSDLRTENLNTRTADTKWAGHFSDGELVQASADAFVFTAARAAVDHGDWVPILSTGSGGLHDSRHDTWVPILSTGSDPARGEGQDGWIDIFFPSAGDRGAVFGTHPAFTHFDFDWG